MPHWSDCSPPVRVEKASFCRAFAFVVPYECVYINSFLVMLVPLLAVSCVLFFRRAMLEKRFAPSETRKVDLGSFRFLFLAERCS